MENDNSPTAHNPSSHDQTIEVLEARLLAIDTERRALVQQLAELKRFSEIINPGVAPSPDTFSSAMLSTTAKLALFRRLFRGREDVYARRWEDANTGKAGYAPACRYEWPPGATNKSQAIRILLPLTDEVILSHLNGEDAAERRGQTKLRDYAIGIYPLLPDDTCWLLAIDFDKASWHEDALAYMDTCRIYGVPAALERSRSGNGGHIWIFFEEAIPASIARKLGSFLLTRTMGRRPEIGLDSYDRLFPNQDTMPSGGFGNLIALPLQRKARQQGNSVFVDERLIPYKNQIAYLSTLSLMSRAAVEGIVEEAQRSGQILGVRVVVTDEDDQTMDI